jgi:hypothetical protein
MKILCTVFLLVLLFATVSFSQAKKEESNATLKAATIKITLLDLPGVNLEKSKWEVAYELRIITRKELYGVMVNGRLNLDADKKIGEFIAKDSFTKNILSKKENREVILTVPLDDKIQKKLADELESISKSNAAAPNGDSSEPAAERGTKTQVFVMYAKALVYDAKLKKNIIVPFNWLLPFARFAHFPGANFQTTFQIKENGEFAKSIVLPEKTKNSITITTKQ